LPHCLSGFGPPSLSSVSKNHISSPNLPFYPASALGNESPKPATVVHTVTSLTAKPRQTSLDPVVSGRSHQNLSGQKGNQRHHHSSPLVPEIIIDPYHPVIHSPLPPRLRHNSRISAVLSLHTPCGSLLLDHTHPGRHQSRTDYPSSIRVLNLGTAHLERSV
jgi:hypothetical protein